MRSKYQDFRESLKKNILILDGSMGALLQKRGLPNGYAPDLWNIENPNAIYEVHKEYITAGSNIIITNTFGASRIRLKEYDADHKIKEINQKAVELALKAANGKAFVAGDIGPLGESIFPSGTLTYKEAFKIFREQAQILIDTGVDLLIVETIFDALEFKAALSAIRCISDNIPVIALMTFNVDGLSDSGISSESTVAIAEGFHVDAVGANCSIGPDKMLSVIAQMKKITNLYLCAQPNAGMPKLQNSQTIFPLSAQDMAEYIPKFLKSGVRILGGCCGTNPDYIKEIKKLIKEDTNNFSSYSIPQKKNRVLISSKNRLVSIGNDYPFVMVGEKINPSGRKKIAQKIKEGNVESLLDDAENQTKAGAHLLDINVGIPLIDEKEMIKKIVLAVQNKVDTPLVIDSSNNEALLAGSEVYPGRALLNSLNGEDEKIHEVLQVMKESGSAVIALLTHTSIPEKAEERIKIAEKILKLLYQYGFDNNDVVFDCLGLTVSAMKESCLETLKTIELIHNELKCTTIMGASNVSFGLPNRRFVHQSFLNLSIQKGLNSAIMNVLEKDIAIKVAASELFCKRKNVIEDYLEKWSDTINEEVLQSDKNKLKKEKHFPNNSNITNDNDSCNGINSSDLDKFFIKQNLSNKFDFLEREIFNDILEGKSDKIVNDINQFLQERSSTDSFNLFLNVMTPAIRYLGELFAKRKKFIPHLVQAGKAMEKGVELLQPYLLDEKNKKSKGKIIFATVKGDIHDIGKNICVLMLKNFGYQVYDLGKNIDKELIFQKANEVQAEIIALSALMTTTMIQMKDIVEENRNAGYSFKIMIGGAPVTREFAQEIGADGYSDDAGKIVDEAESLLKDFGYKQF